MIENLIAGSGENIITSSDSNLEYIIMREPTGNITFTYVGDSNLEITFKDWEKLGVIDSLQHQEILGLMNSCEWDKVIDIDANLNIIKKDKYTVQEREAILLQRQKDEEKAFYEKEKTIAYAIKVDYDLKLEPITEVQTVEVMEYVKSIKPTEEKVLKMISIPLERPAIMGVYEKRLGLVSDEAITGK